ncbi:MAG: radical SAM protein [Polyangiaceae bacterium]|nr:radical SAM protein [Polyangiaceae bacterium]
MAVRKPQKVLLINYAGYFLCANTFIPDNSVSGLTAVLARHGVPAEVIDLQSPRWLGSVMDHTSRDAAKAVLEHLVVGKRPSDSLIRRYHEDRRRGEDWLQAFATNEILRKIEDERIGLVGFKLWGGEGIRRAMDTAEAIRAAHPEVTLIAGGPAVQYCEHYIFELTDAFDALVPGDGEQAIVAAAFRERGEAWPRGVNLLTRGEQWTSATLPAQRQFARDLDDVPFPRYDCDSYPGIEEFYKLRIIDESRGCFNACSFCSHPRFDGHGTRKRQAAAVVDEMERLQRDEGTSYFRLSGSNPPHEHVLAIAQEILRRGLKVEYSVFLSLNNAEPEAFEVLRRSGLSSAFMGIESGHPDLLRRAYNKHNGSRDHVVRVCRAAMAQGIFVTLSFIVPGPFETEATKAASLDLIADIFAGHNDGSVIVLPALLVPHTRWWNHMECFGFEFGQGLDRRSYILRGAELTNDYLLPRDSWADYGYRLNGKTMVELLGETEQFVHDVERLGVMTHLDDASYMLARMGGVDPHAFKARVLQNLLLGGADELSSQVRQINGASHPPGS